MESPSCSWYRLSAPSNGASGRPMTRAVFSRDVHPVTDFKSHASEIVDHAVASQRPVLITRRGRGVAVVLDLEQYERMADELDFGRAVDEGAAAAERGEFADDAEVQAAFRAQA